VKRFELENRYIVFKKKHLNPSQIEILEGIEEKLQGTVDCVVIQEEWPEYDFVVNLLRDRVDNSRNVNDLIQYRSDGSVIGYSDIEEKWITLREAPASRPAGIPFSEGQMVRYSDGETGLFKLSSIDSVTGRLYGTHCLGGTFSADPSYCRVATTEDVLEAKKSRHYCL
jgi:hypothetical protein